MTTSALFFAALADIIIDDNNNNTTEIISDSNIEDMYNFSIKKLSDYIRSNNFEEYHIYNAYSNYSVTERIVKSYDINQNIKNCILIASLLSILKDPFYFNDVNIKDFICGSNDEITLIMDMINIIFQKNNISSNEKWKLIPKYVTIFNKIGCIGIYKFINHLNLSSNINFYDEIKMYCKIILNYSYLFDNEYTNDVYPLRLKEINKVYEFINSHSSITLNDIDIILD